MFRLTETMSAILIRRSVRAVCLAVVLMGAVPMAWAQTVAIEPEALIRVPVQGVGGEHYWQQLVITLAHPDEPDSAAVRLALPDGVEVADTDADGAYDDEIRVAYVAVGGEEPGFASSGSDTVRIVVGSAAAAAAGGRIYLQFPITVNYVPLQATLPYGALEFADPREADLSQGPSISLVTGDQFRALSSMDIVRLSPTLAQAGDTTTAALGAYFPDAAEVLVQGLPDLVFDGGQVTSSELLPAADASLGDGRDDNDTLYRFYWSTSPSLSTVDASTGIPALAAGPDSSPAYYESEGSGRSIRLLTRDLPAGVYYLYAATELTAGTPLVRSRPLRVRHQPTVQAVRLAAGEITLDSGGLLDAGGQATGTGVDSVAIAFASLDYDDELRVALFYSASPELVPGDVVAADGTPTALTGAEPLTGAESLPESGSFTWKVLDPVRVPAGDYYVYAAVADAGDAALGRTAGRVHVRHSPSLRLDPLDDGLTGADTVVTGGARPQRYLTFTWGRTAIDGDTDVDDDARIALFYSTRPAATPSGTDGWQLPGGADQLLASLGVDVWTIASDLSEDADGRESDRFIWDLWALAEGSGTVPPAGVPLYVYGIIADDASRRLVQLNGGRSNDAGSRLLFAHPPTVRVLQPVTDLTLRPGASGRVRWEDSDLDSDARLRVLLSLEDLGRTSDYATLMGASALVVNSTDGHPAAAVDSVADLSEDSGTDHLDIRVEALGAPAGLYYPYVAITDGDRFDAHARAWRGTGRVEIAGVGEAVPEGEGIALLPRIFSLEAGGTQEFEVRIDDGGAAIDLALVALAVDTARFSVVDQNAGLAGVQPFAVGSGFSAARLVTNRLAGAGDGSQQLLLEYLEPTAPRITGLDGTTALATFALRARDQVGEVSIDLAADGDGEGISRLEQDGEAVVQPVPGAASEGILVVGRAAVRGRVLLEGRSSMDTAIDFSLRAWGSHAPLADSLFAVANDENATRVGVQVSLAADGTFELDAVPQGRFDLHVHRDGYLDGWAPGLELSPTDTLGEVSPETPGGEGRLLGGDVTGAAVAGGAPVPDNEVTLADWDYVAAHFGALATDGGDAGPGDVTGDGAVDIRDLSLVGANFLGRGPQPVYKPTGAPLATLLLSGADPAVDAGETVSLTLCGEDLDRVRALQATIEYSEADWELAEVLPGASFLNAVRRQPGSLTLAAVLPGRQRGFGSRRELAGLTLRARRSQPSSPVLATARLLDLLDRDVPARLAGHSAAVPTSLELGQNYPNPFNPQTTVPFRVPAVPGEQAVVHLEVFDVLGQRVATLCEGPLPPGEYRFSWDGRDQRGSRVASGLYLCRLHILDVGVQVRRMLLVR